MRSHWQRTSLVSRKPACVPIASPHCANGTFPRKMRSPTKCAADWRSSPPARPCRALRALRPALAGTLTSPELLRTDRSVSNAQCERPRTTPLNAEPASRSDPGHHHVFDLDIFFHAVMRAFSAEAGLLDAAERRNLGGDQSCIDADHARLQRLGYPPDSAEISRIEVRGESERRIVAHRNHVGLVLEAEHRCKRAERFLLRHQRIGRDVRQDRGLEEATAKRMAFSPSDDL